MAIQVVCFICPSPPPASLLPDLICGSPSVAKVAFLHRPPPFFACLFPRSKVKWKADRPPLGGRERKEGGGRRFGSLHKNSGRKKGGGKRRRLSGVWWSAENALSPAAPPAATHHPLWRTQPIIWNSFRFPFTPYSGTLMTSKGVLFLQLLLAANGGASAGTFLFRTKSPSTRFALRYCLALSCVQPREAFWQVIIHLTTERGRRGERGVCR